MSLADRKRQLVADELSQAALTLLAARGFEAVTVDEIAAAAGMSKRTFFRYFASKEDVVIQFLAEMGGRMRAELAARPVGEPLSSVLHHTIWSAIDACAGQTEPALRVVRLIMETPALRARFLERQAQWQDDLALEIARRLRQDPTTDLYPQLAAGLALTAFRTVLQRWSTSNGAEDPGALTDQTFALIAPALDA
ncbi:TetR family transcriptional regulator [Amycolatopsis rhizosphaerae]|uniref:TetR family transcriptional regulator n=1 Tax=Amycolatopsis rhizosphaerae TaxID=2053003 RepID=A0A558DLV6_9PSEU|nr:TetR family transcriptional regulator [Amycolatopsis rhizosphaerae]